MTAMQSIRVFNTYLIRNMSSNTRFVCSSTVPNLGNDHIVIDRKQWGAAKVAVAPILEHPIPHVVITHIGALSNPCDSVYNCSIKMRTIQDKAVAEQNIVDLKANFYVIYFILSFRIFFFDS